eukprot:1595133-Amphidinium_carterae.4
MASQWGAGAVSLQRVIWRIMLDCPFIHTWKEQVVGLADAARTPIKQSSLSTPRPTQELSWRKVTRGRLVHAMCGTQNIQQRPL